MITLLAILDYFCIIVDCPFVVDVTLHLKFDFSNFNLTAERGYL